MRRLFCLSVLSFLLSSCSKDLIHPRQALRLETGTTNRLNRILFVNDTLGFVCGGARFDESDMLITHNGGKIWKRFSAPDAAKELFGMTLAPDGSVWAIGFDGKVLHTLDGGQTWRFFQLRFEAYKALAFQDATHYLAVGGISFERGDAMYADTGGVVSRHDSLGYELNDIRLLPDGSGWRCGNGVMQHTVDHGASWDWQNMKNDNYTSLDVHSAMIAFTCGGAGSVCATHDGGATWETLRNGNDMRYPKYRLQDLVFTDTQHGYAVGEEGVVIYTDDGGHHWSELERFTNANLHGIAKGPDGSLYVCGEGGELWQLNF